MFTLLALLQRLECTVLLQFHHDARPSPSIDETDFVSPGSFSQAFDHTRSPDGELVREKRVLISISYQRRYHTDIAGIADIAYLAFVDAGFHNIVLYT